MKYEIKYKPAYSLLVVQLSIGESLTAEAGAMTYMQPTLDVKTHQREKGFWGTLGMTLVGGQSFFINDFTATAGSGEAAFSSAPLGDIEMLDVRPDKGFIIQKAAYVASQQGVPLDIQWQGLTKGLFGQGLFIIKVSGAGPLVINTFVAIHTLIAGEKLIADNHLLVAFSDTCQYKVIKFGGSKRDTITGTVEKGRGCVFPEPQQNRNILDTQVWFF